MLDAGNEDLCFGHITWETLLAYRAQEQPGLKYKCECEYLPRGGSIGSDGGMSPRDRILN